MANSRKQWLADVRRYHEKREALIASGVPPEQAEQQAREWSRVLQAKRRAKSVK